MTPDLKQRIERVLELNDERTPGEWKVKYNHGCLELHMGESVEMCDETYYPWVPKNDCDWEVIASAPEMAQIIRELVVENEELEAKLDMSVDQTADALIEIKQLKEKLGE